MFTLKKMAKVLIFLVAVYLSGGYAASLPQKPFRVSTPFLGGSRIVGGEQTTIEEHPYQVALLYSSTPRCGGSILNEYTVLTAAHCVYGYSIYSYYARVGSTNYSNGPARYKVIRASYHSQYNPNTLENDIAVFKFNVPFVFGATVQPVQLISAERTLEAGYPAVISGWGITDESNTNAERILRHAEVSIVDRSVCQSIYSQINPVTSGMICAGVNTDGSKGACERDTGGPLVVDSNVLVGIVSWGYGCATPGYPGVYTNVQAYLDWIAEKSA